MNVILMNVRFQNEERAIQEAAMLAKQMDEAHGAARKAQQAASEAELKAATLVQEIDLIKAKAAEGAYLHT